MAAGSQRGGQRGEKKSRTAQKGKGEIPDYRELDATWKPALESASVRAPVAQAFHTCAQGVYSER